MTAGGDFELLSVTVLEVHIQNLYPLVWRDGVEETFLLQMRKLKLRGITRPVQDLSTHYESKTQGTLLRAVSDAGVFWGGL